MKIDRALNLVMQIQTAKNGLVYVHSTPISRSIFEQFYLEIGKVFSQCFDSVNQAHLALSAPQLAYPALKSISIKAGNWEGAGGVKFGLVNEIVRLTNVILNGDQGWYSLPFDTAVKRGIIDEDEEAEVLSSLVFFYCNLQGCAQGSEGFFLGDGGVVKKLGAYILGLYGIPEWFADLDQGRQYWRDNPSIIADLLDYLSGAAFGTLVREFDGQWIDAEQYRQRHLIKAIESKSFF